MQPLPPPPALYPPANAATVPWWHVGVMWLVVGGPALVVVASFALLATAVRHADVVVPRVEVRGAKSELPTQSVTPTMPAMQGRNHSATPAP